MEEMKFHALFSYDSSRVVLMNHELGFGAKSMLDVYTRNNISILVDEFVNSRFDCLFYPPFLISSLKEDLVRKEISSLINSISTGSIYREFILKSRSLFSYFSHDPEADYSNHSDYHKSLSDASLFGKVKILNENIKSNSQNYELEYLTSDSDRILFTINCFTVEGLEESIENYSAKFPPYLLYKRGSGNKVRDYINEVFSSIRYSSKSELLLKLATFTFDIDTSNVLSTPITSGKKRSYSIKSFGEPL